MLSFLLGLTTHQLEGCYEIAQIQTRAREHTRAQTHTHGLSHVLGVITHA